VNNLEPTRGIENTITGQMIDIEELTEQKLDPPTRETGNLDTLTMQNKLGPSDIAVKNATREET
jgi:hypothetical protein